MVAALAEALVADPGRPLVTFYDGATGERVELSVKTFDNWVSKIANLFSDDLMLEPGDALCVDLPTHWQSTVTMLAAWTAGLTVLLTGAPSRTVAASVVGPARRTDPASVAGQPIACSLRPLGGPFLDDLPEGWLDFGREVPSQPDVLLTPSFIRPEDVAVVCDAGSLTHRRLVDRALDAASEFGLADGGRLVTDADPTLVAGLVGGLVAPIITRSSVVLLTNGDDAQRAEIADQERVTAAFWLPS